MRNRVLLSLQSDAMQLRDRYFCGRSEHSASVFYLSLLLNLSDESSSDRCTEQNAECQNQRESDTVTLGEKD